MPLASVLMAIYKWPLYVALPKSLMYKEQRHKPYRT